MKRQDREEPWNCRSSAVAVGPLKLTTKAVTWPKIQGGSGILGPSLNIFFISGHRYAGHRKTLGRGLGLGITSEKPFWR